MKKEKEFCDMDKDEKRKFLSLDMTERIIRVEQTIASKFGDSLKYDQTNCFKSLSKYKKKEFRSYVKKKNEVNKILKPLVIILPVILLFLLGQEITGRVIINNLKNVAIEKSSYLLTFFLLFFIIFLIFFYIRRNIRNRSFNRKTEVLYKDYHKNAF